MKTLWIFGAILFSLGIRANADTLNSGNQIIAGQMVVQGTMTVVGNAFSVGGSTLAVANGLVGVGTNSPNATLQAAGTAILGGLSTQTLNSGNAFQIGGGTLAVTMNGHIETKGTAPTLSSCGTSPSIAGNDMVGTITVGSSPSTTCNLTFHSSWTNAPSCMVVDYTTSLSIQAPTTTTGVSLTASATFGAGDSVAYICLGRQ